MKTETILKISLILTFLSFISCQGNKNKKSDNNLAVNTHIETELTDSLYMKELVEKQLDESIFFISIPENYTIDITEGPDFYVYYFYSPDTTVEARFNGGIYFGNHPDRFSKDYDSCKIGNSKSRILCQDADWEIYNCNKSYSVQTLIEVYNSDGWNNFIHAFGHAKSKADLIKLMTVFKTMKRKDDAKEEMFIHFEHYPEFPGGNAALMKFMFDNLRYPVTAINNGIEGRVIVTFIVNEDGTLSDIQVVRGIDLELDKEAIRLVKSMPKWEPGMEKGEKVKMKFTLPVVFRLEKD